MVRCANLLAPLPKGPCRVGFFTAREVGAEHADEACQLAIQLIKKQIDAEELVLNDAENPPVLAVTDVWHADESHGESVDDGFVLYREEPDPPARGWLARFFGSRFERIAFSSEPHLARALGEMIARRWRATGRVPRSSVQLALDPDFRLYQDTAPRGDLFIIEPGQGEGSVVLKSRNSGRRFLIDMTGLPLAWRELA